MSISLLLAMCVVVCSSLGGWSVARASQMHCRQLAEMIRAVRVLRTQIICLSEPVGRALLHTEYPLFQAVSKNMGLRIAADEAWRKVANSGNESEAFLLTDAEKKCVERMLSLLGSGSSAMQEEILTNCALRLEEMLSEVQEHTRKISRLYTSLGFLLGLSAVILII